MGARVNDHFTLVCEAQGLERRQIVYPNPTDQLTGRTLEAGDSTLGSCVPKIGHAPTSHKRPREQAGSREGAAP